MRFFWSSDRRGHGSGSESWGGWVYTHGFAIDHNAALIIAGRHARVARAEPSANVHVLARGCSEEPASPVVPRIMDEEELTMVVNSLT